MAKLHAFRVKYSVVKELMQPTSCTHTCKSYRNREGISEVSRERRQHGNTVEVSGGGLTRGKQSRCSTHFPAGAAGGTCVRLGEVARPARGSCIPDSGQAVGSWDPRCPRLAAGIAGQGSSRRRSGRCRRGRGPAGRCVAGAGRVTGGWCCPRGFPLTLPLSVLSPRAPRMSGAEGMHFRRPAIRRKFSPFAAYGAATTRPAVPARRTPAVLAGRWRAVLQKRTCGADNKRNVSRQCALVVKRNQLQQTKERRKGMSKCTVSAVKVAGCW
ncbi:uncharacterized protein LOC128852012 [Cuculus canorus]|uniref:uncharacterized protein LOC128852012 n=1 Tax=Cuculus canorus TaxID=55661 RepID=UPI0023AA48F5|nr:uncharacterized protein LOC128852012 [Cuculus canorus]